MMWKIQRAKQDYAEFILRRIHLDPLSSRVAGAHMTKFPSPLTEMGGRGSVMQTYE